MVYKNVLSLKAMQQDNSIVNSMLKKKWKKILLQTLIAKDLKILTISLKLMYYLQEIMFIFISTVCISISAVCTCL